MFPTEPYVRAVLGPYENQLCEIIRKAWNRVTAMPERSGFDFKRTVATLMHQMLMNEVRASLILEPNVHAIEAHETIRLLLQKTILLRLKKMDRRGYASAIQTQACLALTNVSGRLPFQSHEVPEVFTIDMGYVLNDLSTKIDHILVAARFGESVIWSYQPDESGLVAVASISPSLKTIGSSANVVKLPTKPKVEKDKEQN